MVYGCTPSVGLNELTGYVTPATARHCGKHTIVGPGEMVIGHDVVVTDVTLSRSVNVTENEPDCVGVPVTNPVWLIVSPVGRFAALHTSTPFPPELGTRVGVNGMLDSLAGNVGHDTDGGCVTPIVQTRVTPFVLMLSTTFTVNVYDLVVVGVPVMAPVFVLLSDSPGGKLPDAMDTVRGASPPDGVAAEL